MNKYFSAILLVTTVLLASANVQAAPIPGEVIPVCDIDVVPSETPDGMCYTTYEWKRYTSKPYYITKFYCFKITRCGAIQCGSGAVLPATYTEQRLWNVTEEQCLSEPGVDFRWNEVDSPPMLFPLILD